MKTTIYDISYYLNAEICKESCSNYYLDKYISAIKQKGGEISNIAIRPFQKKIDQNKIEMTRYYNSRYHYFYDKWQAKKITKEEFVHIMSLLKKLKQESNTKIELETKFEKYKKY